MVRRIGMVWSSALLVAGLAGVVRLEAQAGRAALDEGIRLLEANQPGKAEKAFERAIAAEPGVGLHHLWLGRAIGVQTIDASVLRQPFLARRTRSAFEKAVELDPSLLDARDHLIDFYLQAPGVMGGSKEKARAQAAEIARRDASRGHLALSRIAWHGRDTVGAERAARAAIAAAPDSVGPVVLLAQRLESWKRVTEAFALLEAFLARHPDDVAANFRLGRLTTASGQQLARGEAAFRRVLAAPDWPSAPYRPSRAAVQFRLGTLLEKSGRPDDARAAYRAALALDPALRAAQSALDALKD